jgi:hypothetical protein
MIGKLSANAQRFDLTALGKPTPTSDSPPLIQT